MISDNSAAGLQHEKQSSTALTALNTTEAGYVLIHQNTHTAKTVAQSNRPPTILNAHLAFQLIMMDVLFCSDVKPGFA